VIGWFLGGELAPAGTSVSFLRRPFDEVRAALLTWRREELRQKIEEQGPAPWRSCVESLDPFEAPWTVEVLLASGEWTTYLNNWIQGGDPTAAAPYLGTRLGREHVVAMHSPPDSAGHAATQLWLERAGAPVRTIAAHATDGRWSWQADGEAQSFERPERYQARRIRDRLDRPLLVEYLRALGILVDEAAFYGVGFSLRQVVDYPRRRESAAQIRERR
jgi:hypothetical protein